MVYVGVIPGFIADPITTIAGLALQIRKGKILDISDFRFAKSKPNEKVEQEHLPIWHLQMGIDPNRR
jgi:hypothetical protein